MAHFFLYPFEVLLEILNECIHSARMEVKTHQ